MLPQRRSVSQPTQQVHATQWGKSGVLSRLQVLGQTHLAIEQMQNQDVRWCQRHPAFGRHQHQAATWQRLQADVSGQTQRLVSRGQTWTQHNGTRRRPGCGRRGGRCNA
jgi:hypothetical protein